MDHLKQSETGKPSEIETGEIDRISQLPESIAHHILSYFDTLGAPTVELVRMGVLSKHWFHLTASFPILYFSINLFANKISWHRQSFFKYVEYATTRFCHQNLIAHTFNLFTDLEEPAELDIVNRCIELVLSKGVQELEIKINYPFKYSMPKYRLPNILLSVSVLKSLIVSGCELPASLMADVVRFKSLIRLDVGKVAIDDEVIEYLTTCCPLLEEFYINVCYGFKRVCTYGHRNLKKLFITGYTELERIDIDAPNLCDLSVIDVYERGAPRMNLSSCQKLTTITYIGNPSPNSNGFTGFLSNFPFVENLILVTKYKCNYIKWSSHSLRTLVLQLDCDLEGIEFNTPNLVLFIYTCDYCILWPIVMNECWPLLRDSTHLKKCMQCYPRYLDSLWFQKLRKFFDKKNGFKVLNLYINTAYCQDFTELEQLKVVELPPYDLEHVELQLDTCEKPSAHIAFVGAVLWCCRPRSLTLSSPFNVTEFLGLSDVVKYTYKKLLEQEDEGHTKIQIVWPFCSKAEKHSRDLKSSSMALPCERKAITFIKEEVVREEAC